MAEGSHGAADVNEMFQKMAQKLGWFHNKQNVPLDPVCQVKVFNDNSSIRICKQFLANTLLLIVECNTPDRRPARRLFRLMNAGQILFRSSILYCK